MPVKTITKIVAYYRLSKTKKGKSKYETIRDAYGLEDQRQEVARFASERGARIVAEFTEIESGTRKKPHRAELEKAIHMAKMHKATIVIGKQDRLGRNAALVLNLMDSGVPFIPVDRPDQSRLETQLRAVIDEEEATRISERTKRGLAIARSQGVKFGFANPVTAAKAGHLRGYLKATVAAGKARHEAAIKGYSFVISIIRNLLDDGAPYEAIAAELNELGHLTSAGKPFHAMAVCRIVKMFKGKAVPA